MQTDSFFSLWKHWCFRDERVNSISLTTLHAAKSFIIIIRELLETKVWLRLAASSVLQVSLHSQRGKSRVQDNGTYALLCVVFIVGGVYYVQFFFSHAFITTSSGCAPCC